MYIHGSIYQSLNFNTQLSLTFFYKNSMNTTYAHVFSALIPCAYIFLHLRNYIDRSSELGIPFSLSLSL